MGPLEGIAEERGDLSSPFRALGHRGKELQFEDKTGHTEGDGTTHYRLYHLLIVADRLRPDLAGQGERRQGEVDLGEDRPLANGKAEPTGHWLGGASEDEVVGAGNGQVGVAQIGTSGRLQISSESAILDTE
jgi:hypothetical protein